MSQILTLEQIRNMSTDDIVNAYRNGYTLEQNSNNVEDLNNKIVSAQDGVTVSTGALLLIGLGVVAYMFIKQQQ